MASTGWVAIALFGGLGVSAAQSQPKPAVVQVARQPIARAQFIREMDVEFRKIDTDKNGQLSSAEIEQFQKLQAAAQAQARNRALFANSMPIATAS